MPRPIPDAESGAFVRRLEELRADGSVAAFARRCGVGESVLRSYFSGVNQPGLEYLVAIADAGGVTVDWLATGRLPKTRAELLALQAVAARAAVSLDPDRLRLALTLSEVAGATDAQPLTPERKAERALALYLQLSKGVSGEKG